MSYDPKTEAVLKTRAIADFTDADFVRLALACLDQAGLRPLTCDTVRDLVQQELDVDV